MVFHTVKNTVQTTELVFLLSIKECMKLLKKSLYVSCEYCKLFDFFLIYSFFIKKQCKKN